MKRDKKETETELPTNNDYSENAEKLSTRQKEKTQDEWEKQSKKRPAEKGGSYENNDKHKTK
jgi:hypothetical protein